jgi:hypothetical protein
MAAFGDEGRQGQLKACILVAAQVLAVVVSKRSCRESVEEKQAKQEQLTP